MNDDTFLTETLSRGVADVETPFDSITRESISAGRRLRRRRTTAAAIGGAACVALLAVGTVGVTQLLSSGSAAPESPGFASGPSDTASPAVNEAPTTSPATSNPVAPVRLDLAGWSCDASSDEKMWCTGPNGINASINWRPAAYFNAWHGGDPDKTTDWVGATLHGRWFATVSLTERDPALARQLGQALIWQ